MPLRLKQRVGSTLEQPTIACRLLYYLLFAVASGVLIGVLYLGAFWIEREGCSGHTAHRPWIP